ncbi:hypothetical protein ACFVWG_28335 [Kribbella sp. NPDC058245]|uniref:hypothetical protein n=1 Tax=Kribbella sp. NPDC058245 TaxID=3346399 RepID=UPI0036EADB23
MSEAPQTTLSGGKRRLLFEASAPVPAAVDELRALIDGDWLLHELGWDAAVAVTSGPGVGRSPGLLSLQGGWWYRGEYTAERHGGETRLVHRVFNVARQGTWAPALANRLFIGYRADLQRAVESLAVKAAKAVRS